MSALKDRLVRINKVLLSILTSFDNVVIGERLLAQEVYAETISRQQELTVKLLHSLSTLFVSSFTDDDDEKKEDDEGGENKPRKTSKKRDASVARVSLKQEVKYKIIAAMVPSISLQERVNNLQLGIEGITNHKFARLLIEGKSLTCT